MKIQELRNLIKGIDRELLEKAFAECYKQFTKNQKLEADQIVQNILEGKPAKTAKKKEPVDFKVLTSEITEFITNAYAQNYLVPNRVIPKNERPKWRFAVKNYIRELEKISPEDENSVQAAKLLTDLYHLMCEAYDYGLFSTDDPFRSIGWDQVDLFQMVVKKTFALGYSRERISALLLEAVGEGTGRSFVSVYQEYAFVEELKTSDTKYMAIEEAQKLVAENKEKLAKLAKNSRQRYYRSELINELSGMVLMISAELAEIESGIKYYFKNCQNSTREITLFRALEILEWLGDDADWLQVYEYGIGLKIKPRDCLIEKYEQLKSEGL